MSPSLCGSVCRSVPQSTYQREVFVVKPRWRPSVCPSLSQHVRNRSLPVMCNYTSSINHPLEFSELFFLFYIVKIERKAENRNTFTSITAFCFNGFDFLFKRLSFEAIWRSISRFLPKRLLWG